MGRPTLWLGDVCLGRDDLQRHLPTDRHVLHLRQSLLRRNRHISHRQLVNALIYTVAIGDEYRRLAQMLVQSLRFNGFCGGVIVLSDSNLAAPCRTITVDRGELEALRMTGPDVLYVRTVADRFIPQFFDFDYLLHIDADVLCMARIDEILAELADRSAIAVQRYNRPLSAVGQNFTPHDWSLVRGQPFAACGAIVGFPGGQIGRDFLRVWAFESAARRFDDQTALNVVLHRAYAGNFAYFPRATFWPSVEQAALVHFLGYRDRMQSIFESRYAEALSIQS